MGKLPIELIKRKFYEIKDSNGSYGTKPEERDINKLINNGIIILDKPAGPTSHNVSGDIKKLLNIKKAGHAGTLDPQVTGVLPIALGDATKINHALLNTGKEYVCTMHIHKDIEENLVKNELNKWIGKIKQIPPVKSAVKREEREREIYYIEFLEMKKRDITIIVGCEGGTYIRKLCSDLGEKSGWGAHMQELKRTKAGPFNEKQCVKLDDLKKAIEEYKKAKSDGEKKESEKKLKKMILPIESAVSHLPKIYCMDEAINYIKNGRSLLSKDISEFEEFVKVDNAAILTLKGELAALGIALCNSKEIGNKFLCAKIERVFL